MTRTPPGRLPGEPRSGDRDYGPLGGLADDVHYFVKERQRTEDALARSVGRDRGLAPDSGPPATLRRRLGALLRRLRRA